MALGSFSPVEVSVIRGVGALAILIPIWWWQEGARASVSPRDAAVFSLLGLFVLGNHLLTLFGLRYIGAASAGVVIGAAPVVTALLSAILIGDASFRSVWLGCMLSFAGVALVTGVEGGTFTGERTWLGGTLIMCGLVSWALYSIGSRRTMERFSPLTVNWTTLLISILLQIPLLWIGQGSPFVRFRDASSGAWWALAYLIIFATAVGQQAWLYGVQGVGPTRAGIFLNLIPVSALVLSALLLGDHVGARQVIGILLILTGVWLVNRSPTPFVASHHLGSANR